MGEDLAMTEWVDFRCRPPSTAQWLTGMATVSVVTRLNLIEVGSMLRVREEASRSPSVVG